MSEDKGTIRELLKSIAKGSLFLGVMLGLGALCLNEIINDFSITWNQVTTDAKIISFREDWEERNDGRTVVQVIIITYGFTTPSGQYYEGNGRIETTPPGLKQPPQTVTIAYDSRNPENNRGRTDSFYRYTSTPVKLLAVALIGFFLLRADIKFLWNKTLTYQQTSFNLQNPFTQRLESKKSLFLLGFVLLYILAGFGLIILYTEFPPFLTGDMWKVLVAVGASIYFGLWLKGSFVENLIKTLAIILWLALVSVAVGFGGFAALFVGLMGGPAIGLLGGWIMDIINKRKSEKAKELSAQDEERAGTEN